MRKLLTLALILFSCGVARAQTYSLPAKGEVDGVNFSIGSQVVLSSATAGTGNWSVTLIVATQNGNSGWIGTPLTLTNATAGLCAAIPTPSAAGRSVVGDTNGAFEASQITGAPPFPLTVTINSTGCAAAPPPPPPPPLTQITVRALYDDGTPVAGGFRIDDTAGNNVVSETLDSTGLFQGNLVLSPTTTYSAGIQFVGPAGTNVSLAITEPQLSQAAGAILLTLLGTDEVTLTITKATGAFNSITIGPIPPSPAPAAIGSSPASASGQ